MDELTGYIFVGFDVSEVPDMLIDIPRFEEKFDDIQFMNCVEYGCPDEDTKIIGYDIQTWDNIEDMEFQTLDVADWADEWDWDGIRKEFSLPEDTPIKFFVGTRA